MTVATHVRVLVKPNLMIIITAVRVSTPRFTREKKRKEHITSNGNSPTAAVYHVRARLIKMLQCSNGFQAHVSLLDVNQCTSISQGMSVARARQ